MALIGSRGQMFLIAAVVVVSAIVILGLSTSSPNASQGTEAMKTTFEGDMFDNLVNEFNSTIEISSNSPDSISSNVINFANFTQWKEAGESMNVNLLFVGITASKKLDALSVTTFNMLGNAINASIVANGQTQSNTSVANKGRWDTSFSITSGNTYMANITYNSAGGSFTTYSIQVVTKKSKNTYTGFFYITMAGSSSNHVSIFQRYFTL